MNSITTNWFRRAILTWVPALISGLALSGCDDEGSEDEPSGFRGLEDGLELHWTFEDSVGSQITDLSGNGRHGTLQGGGTLVNSPLGQAVSLDGVNDYISLVGPRSPALYGGADGSFTLSARVRVADVGKYNTLCTGCGPFATMYVGTAGYGPVVMSALDDQASAGKKWPKSSAVLAADTWTQVTLVVENGSSARYYVDCALSGQLDDPNIGLEDSGYSAVGLSGNASRWFQGEIDELRVWNRVLTDPELSQLCPIVSPLEQDLEMHWTFEDHVDNQILDMSGNGRHGTNVGGAFVASPVGEALSLDGINDKVSFVGPRALSLYGGAQGDFTVSARVRVADVNKYNTLCVGCGPFSIMYVGDPAPGGRILSNLYNVDTQANLWTVSTPVLANDVWAEVTLVVEGGVAARTYYDCTLEATLDNANIGLRDSGYSAVGESANPSRWYQGEIDELRVWSRALSDEDLGLLCPRALCDGPIYVDIDASAEGDGTTWATAFDTVQAALDAASECTDPQLWVAEGDYAPDPTARVATITYPVAIYGGFAGSEDSLDQRDIVAHPVRFGADDWLVRVVEVADGSTPEVDSAVRLDGIRISGSTYGAIALISGGASLGMTYLANLTLTDNTNYSGRGAAILAEADVEISNSIFDNNRASNGGAITTRWASITILDSSFVANHATYYGGAIQILDGSAEQQVHLLSGNSFTGNTAKWGGAIMVDDHPIFAPYVDLTIVNSVFDANEAGGAAIYLEESECSIDGVLFTNSIGSAIQLANGSPDVDPGYLDISNSRFVNNHAVSGSGGALRLLDTGATVINTEFVGNTAATIGGAVYGRGTFVGSTFTGNTAPNAGSGLWAPAGADMQMRHCVVYPDTIVGADIYGPNSCTKSVLLGAPRKTLVASPFAPTDLDSDGLTEYYLLPGACPAFDGGVIEEFDWTSLTVDASQCTDANWPDSGVHYPPQSAVGACE